MAAIVRNRFYPMIALALGLFIIVGFSRTYYLRFLSDLPPLRTLVQVHGAVFTAWVVLLVAQTRLVAAHRVDLHMKLGIAGAILAVLIVAVGVATAIANSAIPRIRPNGLTPAQFTIVGLTSIGLFAAFVALGIAYRRRPALHKRFMVLATIAALSPPASRLLTLVGLREYSSILIPFASAGFVVWCLLHDWRQHRVVHPAFLIGGVVIVASWPLRLIAGHSDWYQPIAQWFASLAAG